MVLKTQSSRSMNFAFRQPSTWLGLVIATVIGGFCAIAFWVGGGNPITGGKQTASIGEISEKPVTIHASTPTSTHVPKAIGSGSAGSIAVGLEADTVRYYDPATGRAFVAHLRKGSVETISDRKLTGFVHSVWIPNRAAVISRFDKQGTSEYRFFDYATGEVAVIGNAITSLAAAPDGRRIAFIDTENDTTTINISEVHGTPVNRILRIRASDTEISWPQQELLALTSRRPDRSGTDLTLMKLDGTELENIISNRENLEYRWSPDGHHLLFSYFIPGSGISLWHLDLVQRAQARLGLPTSARKCAWHSDNETITCGIPSDENLPGDIPADQVATTDTVATIHLPTSVQTTNYTAQKGVLVGVIDPVVSSSGTYVVFPNIFDRRLYYLEL
jgi:hypothetical protein